MKQIKGQLSLFDLAEEDPEDEPSFTIAEFDNRFGIGNRFINGKDVVEITNIRQGELSAEIRNVTLEQKGWYVGARYYINKESFGKWYLAIAENGNVMSCPHSDKCSTYQIDCYGLSYWCGKHGKEFGNGHTREMPNLRTYHHGI